MDMQLLSSPVFRNAIHLPSWKIELLSNSPNFQREPIFQKLSYIKDSKSTEGDI